MSKSSSMISNDYIDYYLYSQEKKPTLNIEVERRHVAEVQREHADIREARMKAWKEMQDFMQSSCKDGDKTLCRITETLSW